ncbi:endolytic transglycosylase MltG [Candidatus Paracaedibacter symbiosus]|uniref:endolytic transglycosylase MltG n=1 Tax=Candidatus Paracaedibacter symbiosus TaxID=244582 RepID=UPI00068D0100|nr:endolytic transglycosylase MltG [Candidatus Paracaedibacter symbiosus]
MFSALILVPVALILWLMFGPGGVYTRVDHGQDTVILIEKGSRHEEIIKVLLDKKLIKNSYVYYVALFLAQQQGKLKAGEFLIPEHATPYHIIRILCCGRVIVHSVTFPEGVTVADVVEKINSLDNLKGPISHTPEEGMLLPETYTYVYGDTKQSIIDRMSAAMTKTVNELWEKSKELGLYKEAHEIIIMASLIEKETGKASERSRIAAVFLNRLKKGMKLQSDPTVTYGLTLGKIKLGRPITKQDLRSETIFNTYVIAGLPPSPIACPGVDALKAAVNPLKTEDLFFVANGNGGHHFSETYSQHTNHVNAWRRLERNRG